MPRRLFRSQHDRVFLGVCGGLGEYFNIDPVIIRIITVVLILATWVIVGVLAYLIVALIVPAEGSTAASPKDTMRENVNDLRNTTSNLGQDIRTTFGSKESQDEIVHETSQVPVPPRTTSNKGLLVLGIIIIAIGILVIFNNIFGGLFWRILWPVLLIVAGVIVVLIVLNRQKR